jgi:hypothetical protein
MRRVFATTVLTLATFTVVGSALAGYGNPPSRTPDPAAPKAIAKANLTMLQGIKQAAKSGPVIEAKYEVDSGVLNLSTYVAKKGFDAFAEVAGPATSATWKPGTNAITDPGDLVNSVVDLTILDEGSIDLATAVQRAASKQPGFVYWAVPTLQNKQPVVGVYVLDNAGKSHHLYIPLR